MISNICSSTSSLLIIAWMQYVSSLERLCSHKQHAPASVLALTCLLIRNLTMTNQATQMLLRVQLIPIRRQSYPRAAGSSSKETPCQHHRTGWSVSLIVCGGLRTLKLCFIYLLRIIGPFHWHVAVPVRMEPLGCQWRVSTDVPFDVKPPSNWEIQVRPGSLETVYNTSRKGWWFNRFVLTMTAEKTGLNQYSAVQEDQHGVSSESGWPA